VYGTKIGGTIFDNFGHRHTAADLLASGNPHKLTVLVHATVQKIVFDTTGVLVTSSLIVTFICRVLQSHNARDGNV